MLIISLKSFICFIIYFLRVFFPGFFHQCNIILSDTFVPCHEKVSVLTCNQRRLMHPTQSLQFLHEESYEPYTWQWRIKTLIRLHKILHAGWFWSLLFVHGIKHFSSWHGSFVLKIVMKITSTISFQYDFILLSVVWWIISCLQ